MPTIKPLKKEQINTHVVGLMTGGCLIQHVTFAETLSNDIMMHKAVSFLNLYH